LETTVDPNTVRTMAQFHSSKSVRTGLKPMLSFSGAAFEEGVGGENGSRFQLMKSLMLDLFRGEEVKEIDVEGLQELISFAASEEEIGSEAVPKVHMRVWRLVTKRSGQKVPRVELEEIGPRVDFRLRRIRDADPALWKEAMKQARGTEVFEVPYGHFMFANKLTSPERRRTLTWMLLATRPAVSISANRTWANYRLVR
jgi:ribosome production factor 2